MTSRDLRIIGALFLDPFASHARIGRRVGITGEAVRKRLANLAQDGVLPGFVATPTPAIFGREGVAFGVDVTDATLEEALALEDVVTVGQTLEGILGLIGFVPPGTVDERTAAWAESLRATRVRYRMPYRQEVTPGVPGPLEWRTLDAMLDDPRRSLESLAEATGLTARTVARRRDALIDQQMVEVTPHLGPSTSGRLFFHLGLMGYTGSTEEALRALPGTIVSERMDRSAASPGLFLYCQVDSLPAQSDLIARAARIPGVQQVQPYLMTDYRLNRERVHGWIQDEIARWNTAKRG